MLYGVRPKLQASILAAGDQLRLYVPHGRPLVALHRPPHRRESAEPPLCWRALAGRKRSLVMVAAPVEPGTASTLLTWTERAPPARTSINLPMGAGRRKTRIPAAYPSWGVANEVNERNRDVLHQILEDAAKNTSALRGSSEQKIGDYYGSCMDTTAIDSEGLKPLQPELDRIQQIADIDSLEAEIAHLQSMGVEAFFGVDSTQDFKDSTQVTGEVDQGGLGNCPTAITRITMRQKIKIDIFPLIKPV